MTKLYDEYISKGGSMMKLFEVIQELMEKAGFFESETTDEEDLVGEEKNEEESLV